MWIGVAASAALFSAGYYQGVLLEHRWPTRSHPGAYDLLYIPSPAQARIFSLGFDTLLADYYWVKSLQYYMDNSERIHNFRSLADLIDLTVGIDPDFLYAYKFAAVAIPYDSGRWHWHNTKRAIDVVQRGAARFPDDWQLHFYLGYDYVNFANRPEDAAREFASAARHPDAPDYLYAYTARLLAVSGTIDRAVSFADEVLRSTSDPDIRAMMQNRLADLMVEKELRRIEAAAHDFREARGRLPRDVEELVRVGGSDAPPPGYSLDSAGVAHGPPGTERMQIHENPGEAGWAVED
jgi:tetratricopeptide (TPR) repeat protein